MVHEDIERAIRRPDLDLAQGVVPEARDRAEHLVEIGGAIFGDQSLGVRGRRRLTQKRDDLDRLASLQSQRRLQRTAGIEARARAVGELRPPQQ